FTVAMGSQVAGLPGEGWSLNFGGIPEDNGTGEGGFAPLPGGLTISFDTLDDGNDPPSIEVFIGGVSIANFPWTFLFDAARTTSATMDVFLDNVKASTQALPVIETGGPIISEFVANNTEFEDEFAEKPGWIELLNGSATPEDLTRWYLTDSKANLT